MLLGAASLMLAACKKSETAATAEETRPHLRASDLYKIDSVTAFIQRYGTQNQDVAWKLHERFGELREGEKPKAVWTLKRALTYYPEATWYVDLGDLLVQTKNFNEAQLAYSIFQKTSSKPSPGQLMNMLKASLLADENSSRYDLGIRVMENGLKPEEIDVFLSDQDIQKRMTPNEIKNFKEYLFHSDGEGDTLLPDFNKFLAEFEEVSLPLTVTETDLAKHKYSEEYMEYETSKDFSKFQYEGSQEMKFYPDYNFKYSFRYKDFIGLIYSADTSATASTRQNRCVYHRLLVYNQNGDLKGTTVIGEHAGENLLTYKIAANGEITTYRFTREWKTPFDKNSPTNELIKTTPTDTSVIFIMEDGGVGI